MTMLLLDSKWRRRACLTLPVLLACAALLLAAVACEGGEEEASPTGTATPSASPAVAESPTREATPVSPVETSPAATPQPESPTAETATPEAGAGLEVGIDVDSSGNSAGSLGTIETCIEKSSGDPDFDVDIYIKDVPSDSPITGYEGYLKFPDTIVTVQDTDTSLFLNQVSGSTWMDLSETRPWTTSPKYFSVADVGAYPSTSETGSGVLARLTLHIVGPGVGTLSLTDADGNATWTVFGNGTAAVPYPGTTVARATIAVDQPCP